MMFNGELEQLSRFCCPNKSVFTGRNFTRRILVERDHLRILWYNHMKTQVELLKIL